MHRSVYYSYNEVCERIRTLLKLLKWRLSSHYDPKLGKSRLPGPRMIQIQTIDRCNGSCPVCPYSKTQRHGPSNLLDKNLYLGILKDLQRAGNTRTLALMLQNEPLLDNNLAERVRQARNVLGSRVFIRTVTNGSLLFPSRIDELFRAGINNIEVSIDAYRKETYAIVRPGLDFNCVLKNTHSLIGYRKKKGVTVRFLKQKVNASEQEEFTRYWKRHGARLQFMGMSNRAGGLNKFDQMRIPERITLRLKIRNVVTGPIPCICGPFERLTVLWDGRVVVCCQDWKTKLVLGDLSSQSLSNIWNGDLTNYYRDLLWHGRFEESPLCRRCSIIPYFPGKRAIKIHTT